MANVLLTMGAITREALMVLENQLVFAQNVNREYDDTFAQTGRKEGDTINVRKPPRYLGRTGPTIQVESSVETTVPVTLTTQRGVDISFTSKERTLDIDDYRERFLEPALASVANAIDYDGMQKAWLGVYNTVGTPGVTPSTVKTFLDAQAKLDLEAAPRDGKRVGIISPVANSSLVDGAKGLFNDQGIISKQFKTGLIGRSTIGLDFYMSQNVATQTLGIGGGTPVINGAGQTGSTIITNGWTAAAAQRLNIGDVFTITGVYAVNPQNRVSTGQLRQFVVTAPGISDGSGNMTISVSPSIIPSGQFQTTDSAPVTGATINLLATNATAPLGSPQNLVFHRDAFTLATTDLIVPPNVECERISSKKSGLSIRCATFWDGVNDRLITRLDVLYGWAVLRPELAVRVAG